MTQESDELVKRLRGTGYRRDLCAVAADALEAQAAEIERLELEGEGANTIIAQERAEVLKLRREIERLRELLDRMSQHWRVAANNVGWGADHEEDNAELAGTGLKWVTEMTDRETLDYIAEQYTASDDTNQTELLPCPFCGSDNLKSGGDDKYVGLWCLNCGAIGSNQYDSRFEWNTRPAFPLSEAAALQKAADVVKSTDKLHTGRYFAEEILALIDPDAPSILAERERAAKVETAKPLEEWHEDDGDVVWWVFPISEPAWIGTPNDDSWPNYHTHWTPHPTIPLIAATEGETE